MQQQAAPAYAPPPADAALQQRIDTLVSYAAKNGMGFVQMMSERQGANPEYAFLHGGEGTPYFAWALHCALSGQPAAAAAVGQAAAPPAAAAPQYAAAPQAAGMPEPQQQQAAAPPQQQHPVTASPTAGVLADLPAEVSSGWGQVLGLLSGSRDSIRNSQAWFMACAPYAAGMAEMMMQQIEALEGHHDRQLHVVYLANDILFKAMSQRPAGSGPEADGIAQAFLPRLGRMLRRTFVSGGQTAEVQANLLRVVNFWAERGVFSHLEVESLTMEMMGPPYGQPPAGFYPPPGAPPGAYPPPPGAGPVGYYPPPPGPEAQPPPPEEEPFDCLSFPPGLLPKLVEESLKTDKPYSPLSIFDIEQTGVPPAPKMDAYLKSRVAKFQAQLADYRPGMMFSDIETGDARHKHFSDRDGSGAAPAGGPPLPPSGPELPHAGLGLASPAGMGMGFGMGGAPGLGLGAAPVDDGSFAGMRSGGTGLGFTRAERRDSGPQPGPSGEAGGGNGMAGSASTALGEAGPELVGRPGDVFSSYRYMRSKGYHQMIVENAAKKFGRGN
ncbi:calcium homeostasis endoplasmic reticulum isoform A [Chlorella sorokiniana]|uniref:Calcium homeostasis endoplasmic reticulum isoform A n=1 Tax=Chlorella sorokiniana TaxID=3076 RepID=A0A2P6TYN2_CHLSO|nr:calcium homeostasis endoplasmic reticulum isoform A [Chlorella sorokiniana]|eukprot:PRW59174.1 calcium homeostasis endoplasmic reticulum isoform A [Chlorella sorokiniana]